MKKVGNRASVGHDGKIKENVATNGEFSTANKIFSHQTLAATTCKSTNAVTMVYSIVSEELYFISHV